MACTVQDNKTPVGVGPKWYHDLSPEHPTFRFKFELLARIRYLESQLNQLGAEGGAAVDTVPREQYDQLKRKVRGVLGT